MDYYEIHQKVSYKTNIDIQIHSLDDIQIIDNAYKRTNRRIEDLKTRDEGKIIVVGYSPIIKTYINYDKSNNGEQIVKLDSWELKLDNIGIAYQNFNGLSIDYICHNKEDAEKEFIYYLRIFQTELERFNLRLINYELVDIKFTPIEELETQYYRKYKDTNY